MADVRYLVCLRDGRRFDDGEAADGTCPACGDSLAEESDVRRGLDASAVFLQCAACAKHYRVKHWTPAQAVSCPTCSRPLAVIDATTIDARAAEPRAPEVIGSSFGRYRLISELGKGGFGTVHLAHDAGLDRRVALKILTGHEPNELARFKREAHLAAGLSHPNIAAVYEVNEDPPYIAMQYIEGETLAKLRLTPREALEAIRDAALAVAYAHERGVIHRDIKPANIMRSAEGRIFVLDFGLAKSVDAETSLSMTGDIMGTPFYMSPEQAQGEVRAVDARSDVWSMGATLYELLTGQRPFNGAGALDVLRQVLDAEPIPPRRINPRLDSDIETIVLKCIEKDPARRYESSAALADDIERELAGDPILARPTTLGYRLGKRIRKNPLVWTAATLAGLALLTLAGVTAGRYVGSRLALSKARGAATPEEAHGHYTRSASLWESTEAREGVVRKRDELERRGRMLKTREERDARAEAYRKVLWNPIWDEIEAVGFAGRQATPERRGELIAQVKELAEQAGAGELPEVWARLMLVGEGEGDLDRLADAAREAEDPMPLLYRVRWNLKRYLAGFRMPRVAVGGAEEQFSLPPWEETDEMRGLMEGVRRDLDRVGATGFVGDTRWIEWLGALREGLRSLLEGKEARAIDDIESAGKAYGRSAEALDRAAREAGLVWVEMWRLQGLAKLMAGEYTEAVRSWRRVLEVHPGWVAVWYDSGAAWMLCGYVEERVGADPRQAYLRAIEDSGRVLEIGPNDAEAYVNRGTARQMLGDAQAARGEDERPAYLAAIEDCERALEIKPDLYGAYSSLGNAWRRLGDAQTRRGEDSRPAYVAAIEDLGRDLEISPNVDIYINRGNAQLSLGEMQAGRGKDPMPAYRAAIDDYGRALEIMPNSVEAHGNRANALVRLGETRAMQGEDPRPAYLAAIDDYGRSLELKPNTVNAHNGRGNANKSLGQAQARQGEDPGPSFGAAIEDFERALRLNPNHAPAYIGRGTTHLSIGEARVGQGKDPRSAYLAAIEDFERALELNPKTVVPFLGRAKAHLGLGEEQARRGHDPRPAYLDAIEDAERALELNPNDAMPYIYRASTRTILGDAQAVRGEDPRPTYRAAIEDFGRALELKPNFVDAYNNRGAAQRSLGEAQAERGEDPRPTYRAAIEDYTRALELNPDSAMAHYNRGLAHQSQGEAEAARGRDASSSYARAIEDFTRALELNPNYAEAHNNRGNAHRMQGEAEAARGRDPKQHYGSAMADFDAALTLNPNLWQMYANKGLLYQAMGRWPDALRAFEAALAINPANTQIKALADEARRRIKEESDY